MSSNEVQLGIQGPTPAETAKSAEALAAMANPSVDSAAAAARPARRRIPMSTPRRKLEVPPGTCPGYVLYWFLQSNIPAALDAGYDFVHRDEISINQTNPANSTDTSGNTDLGSQISVIGNKQGENGQPDRLVLMKIPEAWWREDRQLLDDKNAQIMEAIFGEHAVMGGEKMSPQDRGLTYVRTAAILNKGLPKKA